MAEQKRPQSKGMQRSHRHTRLQRYEPRWEDEAPRGDGTRPRSSCLRADGSSKVGYLSRGDAKTAAVRRRAAGGHDTKPYKCGSCRLYHLGKKAA